MAKLVFGGEMKKLFWARHGDPYDPDQSFDLSSQNPRLFDNDLLTWRNRSENSVSSTTPSLLGRLFSPIRLHTDHDECPICMEPFAVDAIVTALPCDARHYFHRQCVQEWSRRSKACPICRTEFTVAEVRAINQRLQEEALLEKNEGVNNISGVQEGSA